jgi:hypothetical protein
MILLAVIILSAIAAYWGMGVGLYPLFGRCLMAVLAVTAGVGFAGPLRQSIPTDSMYLYGPCLLTIAVLVYWLQRKLADMCFCEPELDLPVVVDRAGGALIGFGMAMLALSYLALIFVALPLPEQLRSILPQVKQIAQVAVGTFRAVAVLAGTGHSINMDTVLPA